MAKRLTDRTMVQFDRACELVDRMREGFYKGLPSATMPVANSLGRRLSGNVSARVRSPPFNISTMDGYAVNAGDGYPLQVTGEVFAGDEPKTIGSNEAVYITTGAIVPGGANAVLKVEDARVEGDALTGPRLEPWTNVIRAGADFGESEVILEKGAVISPAALCILNAAAVEAVDVYEKARVGVLSTGDEIRNGMTRDSNAPMVCALLETWGCAPEHVGIAPDSAEETQAMLRDAASEYDAVVTIGGVAAGKKDFIASTIVGEGEIVFHGYRIRPGKPLLVSYYRGKPVFSLPGKPTGAFTAMELVVKRFFTTKTARPVVVMPVSRDVQFYSKGFDYVVYVQLKGGKAIPMGYEDSPLKLFSGPGYGVSIVSSSPRPMAADGFFIARDDLKKRQEVAVNLLC
ncbi:MAG TPA: molybdopterin molybdotransferase MoeA [Methanocella sp.]|nr:molybdopterin molybdotransferase MoeA [Methanocella sp.]